MLQVVEGAAGVAIAPVLNNPDKYAGKNVVSLICGSNISIDKLKTIINKCSQK